MADPQTLYQVIRPDGSVGGAVTGPEWLQQGERLGPQVDTSARGLGPPPGLEAKTQQPPQQEAVPTPAAPPAPAAAAVPPVPAAPQAPIAAAVPPVPAVTGTATVPSYSGAISAVVPSAQAAEARDPGKFGLGPATPAVQAPKPVQGPVGQPRDPAAFNLGPAAPQTSPPPSQPLSWADVANAVGSAAGGTGAFLRGLPRGIFGGRTVDYVDAATQVPGRMLLDWEGPSTAFQAGLQQAQQQQQQIAQAHPWMEGAGELTGALGGGAALSPYLGWNAASSALPRLGQLGSYIARNAGMGGATSWLNYGDPTTGALIGGALPLAHAIGYAASRPVSWVYQRLRPLWSQAGQDVSLGDQLGNRVGTSQVQTSPVGPLDLAQATNNPTVSAMTDIADQYNQRAVNALRQQQQQAVGNQIGQIAPATTLADASSQGVTAVRALEDFVDQRAGELWGHPALNEFLLPTNQVQRGAQTSLNAVQRDDPGLLLGMTPQIQAAISGIGRLPERANLRNINSYISVLKAVARRPPTDNPRAGALASRLLGDITKSLDSTVSSSGAPSGFRNAYDAARDFTKREHEILGTQDMRALLAKNPEGVFTARPSTALDRFFNFTRGSPEGPANLKQLQDLADEIRQAWLGRGDPFLKLSLARNDLRDAVRGYVAQSLREAAEAGQRGNWKAAQDFIQSNRGWMGSSGLFTPGQLDAADKLLDYLTMLRRPALLQHQANSATARRLVNDKTFVGQIISPWFARSAAMLGAGYGMFMGHPLEGLEHGFAGGMAGELFNKRVEHVESLMRQAMAEALMDPQKAQALMMNASAANRAMLPRRVQEWLDALRIAVQSDVIPHFQGQTPRPAEPAAAQ